MVILPQLECADGAWSAPWRPVPAGPPAPPPVAAGVDRWLRVCLYARPDRHEVLLAEHLPAVLETLPAGVRGWSFRRDGTFRPHLTLDFQGEGHALARLLPNVRRWARELVCAGLAQRLAVRAAIPAGVPGAGAGLTAAAARAAQADSEAVLGQVRLVRVGALMVAPEALVAAGLAQVAQAFRGVAEPAACPAELALLEPWWQPRARTLAEYGRDVRRRAAAGAPDLVDLVLDQLLRQHHNRATGHGGR